MSQNSPNRHRSFYALPLPEKLRREVANFIEELRCLDNRNVRWTPPENLHLTLRFLGELTPEQFTTAQQFLSRTRFPKSLTLHVNGVHGFPSLKKPSVLVLTLEGSTPEDVAALLALQKQTEEWAMQLGLAPENRPFRPHITVGRVRRNNHLSQPLKEKLNTIDSERIRNTGEAIRTVVLMESQLSSAGAQYKVVSQARLGSEELCG